MVNPENLPLDEIRQHFHLPIESAAVELGVCVTVLKITCRHHGIARWPGRVVKQYSRFREILNRCIDNEPFMAGMLSEERIRLWRKVVANGYKVPSTRNYTHRMKNLANRIEAMKRRNE